MSYTIPRKELPDKRVTTPQSPGSGNYLYISGIVRSPGWKDVGVAASVFDYSIDVSSSYTILEPTFDLNAEYEAFLLALKKALYLPKVSCIISDASICSQITEYSTTLPQGIMYLEESRNEVRELIKKIGLPPILKVHPEANMARQLAMSILVSKDHEYPYPGLSKL